MRGWLLPIMAARSNRIIAIAVSSSLFAIMHFSNRGFYKFAPLWIADGFLSPQNR